MNDVESVEEAFLRELVTTVMIHGAARIDSTGRIMPPYEYHEYKGKT